MTRADAVHPGYGFLAENAHFAEVVKKCGLHWIGPRPEVMRLMGDKVSARAAMEKAGVPTLPGTGVIETDAQAEEAVERIGFPVIIKASAGGGGRGMKIVENKARLSAQLAAARSEAQAGFNNPNVYLERFIGRPRHVEVQVLGDGKRAVALGERECSIQRRHQKLVEEAPSVALDDERRAKLLGIARKATETIGYETVGTHEFLLDEDKNFYFMEMNTRIQVEHTVTEEVFGIDLVREQMRLAAGEPLKLATNMSPRGHAIEVRVNAEDPVTFAPSPGADHGPAQAGRAGRPRRFAHLQPVRGAAVLRLAAGEADRPRREPAGRPGPAAAGPGRVRHRGDQDQHRLLQEADPERRIRGR